MASPRYRRVKLLVGKGTPKKYRVKMGWEQIPTMGQAALAEARKWVGVMEQGGNNRGPRVMELIRGNGGTGPEPWCGDAVACWYIAAGSKAVTRSWAAVRFLGHLTGQKVVSSPLPGDIVCFAFDHTGLFVRRDGADHIITIEGNTGASGAVSDSSTGGDGVYVKRRSVDLVSRYVRVTR